jgi:hypothetical protein
VKTLAVALRNPSDIYGRTLEGGYFAVQKLLSSTFKSPVLDNCVFRTLMAADMLG